MDNPSSHLQKKCKECDKVITGRIDKVFCSIECKSAYNNNKYRTDKSIVRKINKILDLNRNILIQLNPEGKRKIARETLLSAGYNFKYYTHQVITAKGNVYHFCYDYGYMQLDEVNFLLVKDIMTDHIN